jgi:hypothetical protein
MQAITEGFEEELRRMLLIFRGMDIRRASFDLGKEEIVLNDRHYKFEIRHKLVPVQRIDE